MLGDRNNDTVFSDAVVRSDDVFLSAVQDPVDQAFRAAVPVIFRQQVNLHQVTVHGTFHVFLVNKNVIPVFHYDKSISGLCFIEAPSEGRGFLFSAHNSP